MNKYQKALNKMVRVELTCDIYKGDYRAAKRAIQKCLYKDEVMELSEYGVTLADIYGE